MSVSEIVKENGKRVIYILFSEAKRSAEGKYPDCKIVKNNGFTKEEVSALESYMSESGQVIEEMAKSISVFKAFSGEMPEFDVTPIEDEPEELSRNLSPLSTEKKRTPGKMRPKKSL